MWEKLNLDLEAHAGLLQVLGKFYGDIFMSQQGRLRGMEYLDFVLSQVHGRRIKELQDAKAQEKRVVGTFAFSFLKKSCSRQAVSRLVFALVLKSGKVKPRKYSPGTPVP